MSFIKILTKKSVILTLGFFVLLSFVMPTTVFAKPLDVGPFAAFLNRASVLFMQTRNALYVIAAFAFIAYAFACIKDGKMEWEKMFYLIIGLVILGVAGFVVSYIADPSADGKYITQEYENFDNAGDWGDKSK